MRNDQSSLASSSSTSSFDDDSKGGQQVKSAIGTSADDAKMEVNSLFFPLARDLARGCAHEHELTDT